MSLKVLSSIHWHPIKNSVLEILQVSSMLLKDNDFVLLRSGGLEAYDYLTLVPSGYHTILVPLEQAISNV